MRLRSLLVFVTSALGAVISKSGDEDRATIPQLTLANFDSTIADGQWFIKFYSPSCPHCVKLAPFWEAAGLKYENYKSSHNFHLGSVDCQVQGDLCQKQNIKGYPTLLLYKDGTHIDEWVNVGSSDPLEPISEFVEKHASAEPKNNGKPIEAATSTKAPKQSASGHSKATASQASTAPKDPTGSKEGHVSAKGEVQRAKTGAPLRESDFQQGIKPKTGSAKKDSTKDDTPVKESMHRVATPLKTSDFDNDQKQTTFSNPSGTSVNLTPESFTKLVTNTKSPWFIKFYAPWCGHCKAMAPAWSELASDFKDKLNVGEVNCEAEARLCADVKVHGYPTILFFEGSKHIEYSGLRGVGDLIAFAKKASNSGIKDVDKVEFETIQSKEEVIFLYFYDDATTSEDFEALERTSLELIGHAPLLKTSSSILANRFRATTFPKLTVIRDGKPQYYPALGPADMRDHVKLLAWMKTAWLPIVPELSTANSHEIMHNRLIVLAVLDPASTDFTDQRAVIKGTAYEFTDKRAMEAQAEKQLQRDKKQSKIDEAEKKGDSKAVEHAKGIHVKLADRQEIGFAWVNGIFWEKWLAVSYQIDVARDGAKVIIYDEDSKRYWDVDTKGKPIAFDKQVILDTIAVIIASPGKIRAKSTKNSLEAAYYAARQASTGHPMTFSALAFLSVIGLVIALLRRRGKRRSSGGGGAGDKEKGNTFTSNNGKYD